MLLLWRQLGWLAGWLAGGLVIKVKQTPVMLSVSKYITKSDACGSTAVHAGKKKSLIKWVISHRQ